MNRLPDALRGLVIGFLAELDAVNLLVCNSSFHALRNKNPIPRVKPWFYVSDRGSRFKRDGVILTQIQVRAVAVSPRGSIYVINYEKNSTRIVIHAWQLTHRASVPFFPPLTRASFRSIAGCPTAIALNPFPETGFFVMPRLERLFFLFPNGRVEQRQGDQLLSVFTLEAKALDLANLTVVPLVETRQIRLFATSCMTKILDVLLDEGGNVIRDPRLVSLPSAPKVPSTIIALCVAHTKRLGPVILVSKAQVGWVEVIGVDTGRLHRVVVLPRAVSEMHFVSDNHFVFVMPDALTESLLVVDVSQGQIVSQTDGILAWHHVEVHAPSGAMIGWKSNGNHLVYLPR